MRFENWLTYQGLAAKTAKNYSTAISGSISSWAIEASLLACPIEMIDDLATFNQARQLICELPIFIQRDTVGKGMYSAALKKYAAYVEQQGFNSVQPDIDEVLASSAPSVTEKQELVRTRLGQGQFRRALVASWNGCAVTGYPGLSLLVASHIKPWRESDNSERLNPYNGLLLLPNLDKAFDLGYISFQYSGQIVVSPQLIGAERLGVNAAMTVKLGSQHQPFMEFHRDCVFRSESS